MQAPEYLKGATNVYRTAKFIVRQVLVVQHDSEESGNIISYDDYYRERLPATNNTSSCFRNAVMSTASVSPQMPIPAVTSIKGG